MGSRLSATASVAEAGLVREEAAAIFACWSMVEQGPSCSSCGEVVSESAQEFSALLGGGSRWVFAEDEVSATV